jgi:hypothetical protein
MSTDTFKDVWELRNAYQRSQEENKRLRELLEDCAAFLEETSGCVGGQMYNRQGRLIAEVHAALGHKKR